MGGGYTQCTFTWKDPENKNLFGIEVSYNETGSLDSSSSSKIISPGTETATITGLKAGATYLFTVRTINTVGTRSLGVQIEITTEEPHFKEVTNLAVSSDDKAVNLSWINPEDDFIGVAVIINHSGNTSLVELDSNVTSYSYTTGEHGESYTFTVYVVYLLDNRKLYSEGVKATSLFLDYDKFENPIMLITLPEGVDDITTKTWLKDQGYSTAECQIINNSDSKNNKTLTMDIKGRGNSSWRMPKKSYSLKLDDKANFLNMAKGKHKSYALISNYADKTLVRNQLAYYMGTDIFSSMDWSPHTKQVNLIVNGRYFGIYMLTERIKIDKQIINIKDISEVSDFSKGGWIVEVNDRLDETYNWRTSHDIPISLKDPDDYSDWTKIQDYLNKVEEVLYGDDFTDPDEGWRKYLDEDSFIDWYLLNEIAKNNDACWLLSVYMYFNPKDNKIYMGPLWDFDIAFGNINYNGCDSYEGFWIKDSGWHSRLFQDTNFVSAVKTRWNEKKADLEALVGVGSSSTKTSISEFANKLKTDAEINFNLWKILGADVWLCPAGYEERTTYQSEVDYLTLWLKNRIVWLDEAIDNI